MKRALEQTLLKKSILVTILSSSLLTATAATLPIKKIADLNSRLAETSGLAYFNKQLWTITDSQSSYLYRISTINGKILKVRRLSHVTRNDWEALTQDKLYLYIGDIGNNFGKRQKLCIYRLSKQQLLHSNRKTKLKSAAICYHYADQTNFNPRLFWHDYDAEALVAVDNKILIFTKNWSSRTTDIYSIPKKPGSYKAQKIARLPIKGLVTDAALYQNKLVLLGYNFILYNLKPFVQTYQLQSKLHFKKTNSTLFIDENRQFEGVTFEDATHLYLSAEKYHSPKATLYSAELR